MIRVLTVLLSIVAVAFADEPPEAKPAASGIDVIRKEANDLSPLFETPVARRFLAAAERLPHVEPRTIYGGPDRQYLSKTAWEKLPAEKRGGFREITIDESRYYNTLYGTPLFYVRVMELLGEHGVKSLEGKKLLDFGYGTIGHLRLMADAGAEVVGVDVDTLQPAIYSEPTDVGSVRNPDGRDGSVRIALGRFPSDEKIRKEIGDGYDIFTSKNTLKNGYIHPAEKVDPRMTIDLGVTDEQYVQHVRDILKPGGLALIYNLCPAPAAEDKPYIPWADGHCPFPREMWEANGFEVLVFDKDDSEFARKMAKALEWDAVPQSMNLEGDLFATWTLVRKKR
ncbi:MAG: hypothetical protein H6819_09320 [Phycisphaerales bacterium]|nr:hypothetical protein [Phycisphaerales bacterium]MCB9855449.1 hypothetical protein [Phycisphaerales bacterium]MCB9864225.1 hypothetical protein [Phycisphaerales bacterium]